MQAAPFGARGVANTPNRVRICRFTGVRAIKVGAPKTEWQIAAEREFLVLRQQYPREALLPGLVPDDVRNLHPTMQKLLTLRCANKQQVSAWRKQQLIRKFALRPFDYSSPAVVIACLTEKILRQREALLTAAKGKNKHQEMKIMLTVMLSRRIKKMKNLYRNDYHTYKHVCKELGIRCIRFAIPIIKGQGDMSRLVNKQAVDGDQAKFLIRRRWYFRKYRPRPMREPETNRLIRYMQHPVEPVPENHGKPKPVAQQVSVSWPYGVRREFVEGRRIVYNPTAPGKGHQPARFDHVGATLPRDRRLPTGAQ